MNRSFHSLVAFGALIAMIESTAVINYQSYISDKNNCKSNEYLHPKTRKCAHFPGGVRPIYVDNTVKCAQNAVGIQPHPDSNIYYYLCEQDSVVIGECPMMSVFNPTSGLCEQGARRHYHNPCNIAFAPACMQQGRFPVAENCSCFYICDMIDGSLLPKMFQCPGSSLFSPLSRKCSYNAHLAPTQVLPSDVSTTDPFPACIKPGQFRTPNNCNLYYTCSAKTHGVFYQSRFKCPDGFAFDVKKNKCRPENEVECKRMTVTELLNLYDFYEHQRNKCSHDHNCECNDNPLSNSNASRDSHSDTELIENSQPDTIHSTKEKEKRNEQAEHNQQIETNSSQGQEGSLEFPINAEKEGQSKMYPTDGGDEEQVGSPRKETNDETSSQNTDMGNEDKTLSATDDENGMRINETLVNDGNESTNSNSVNITNVVSDNDATLINGTNQSSNQTEFSQSVTNNNESIDNTTSNDGTPNSDNDGRSSQTVNNSTSNNVNGTNSEENQTFESNQYNDSNVNSSVNATNISNDDGVLSIDGNGQGNSQPRVTDIVLNGNSSIGDLTINENDEVLSIEDNEENENQTSNNNTVGNVNGLNNTDISLIDANQYKNSNNDNSSVTATGTSSDDDVLSIDSIQQNNNQTESTEDVSNTASSVDNMTSSDGVMPKEVSDRNENKTATNYAVNGTDSEKDLVSIENQYANLDNVTNPVNTSRNDDIPSIDDEQTVISKGDGSMNSDIVEPIDGEDGNKNETVDDTEDNFNRTSDDRARKTHGDQKIDSDIVGSSHNASDTTSDGVISSTNDMDDNMENHHHHHKHRTSIKHGAASTDDSEGDDFQLGSARTWEESGTIINSSTRETHGLISASQISEEKDIWRNSKVIPYPYPYPKHMRTGSAPLQEDQKPLYLSIQKPCRLVIDFNSFKENKSTESSPDPKVRRRRNSPLFNHSKGN